MLLKRMQPYWRNILKNKKIFTGNYYICKKFAMILIVLIVFTGCGQNRITEKEEKKETVESEMNAEVKKTAQTFRSVYMKEKSELNTLKAKRKIINCCLFFFLRCFAKFFYFFTIDHINLIITIYCRISFFFQTIDNFSFHL